MSKREHQHQEAIRPIDYESLYSTAVFKALNTQIEIIDKLQERIKELEGLFRQLIWIAEKAVTDDSEDTTIELAKQALKG